MILQISPESSLLARGAAGLILFLHVSGGGAGIISGATALLSRKGGRLHRVAGNVFFVSMLIMSAIGACVAPFLPERASAVAGILTFYLVASAWLTVSRKDGSTGRLEVGGFIVALGIVAAGVILFRLAANSPTGRLDNQPPQALYLFVLVGSIAAVSDLKVILRGGISGTQRIARHLWRMCTALFIAAASFFLGQQQVLPAFLQDSPILFVPVFAPLVLMIYWLFRVRLTGRFKRNTTIDPRADGSAA